MNEDNRIYWWISFGLNFILYDTIVRDFVLISRLQQKIS